MSFRWILTALACSIFDFIRSISFSVLHIYLPFPYMDSIDIYLMRVIISKYKAEVCLEWGSGYSTLHFPFMSSSIKKWTSIEHDPIWYSIMNKKLDNIKHKQIEIILKTPNTYPWTDEFNDGSYSDLIEYINYPRSTGQKYDFILIDGRARKYCVFE